MPGQCQVGPVPSRASASAGPVPSRVRCDDGSNVEFGLSTSHEPLPVDRLSKQWDDVL